MVPFPPDTAATSSAPADVTADVLNASGRDGLAAEVAGHHISLAATETNAVLDTTFEAFVTIELTGEIVRWNAAAERTFGWSADEAVGRHVDELIIPERFRSAHRAALSRLAAGRPVPEP